MLGEVAARRSGEIFPCPFVYNNYKKDKIPHAVPREFMRFEIAHDGLAILTGSPRVSNMRRWKKSQMLVYMVFCEELAKPNKVMDQVKVAMLACKEIRGSLEF